MLDEGCLIDSGAYSRILNGAGKPKAAMRTAAEATLLATACVVGVMATIRSPGVRRAATAREGNRGSGHAGMSEREGTFFQTFTEHVNLLRPTAGAREAGALVSPPTTTFRFQARA